MPKTPWANARQRRQFQEEKKKALLGLLDALGNKWIPEGKGVRLRTGGLIKCFADSSLPMRTSPLLEVLYEAGVPHDSNNRFVTRVLYTYEGQLTELYRDYVGASEIKLVYFPDVPQVEPESEP